MGRINDLSRSDFARIIQGDEWGVEILIFPNGFDDPISVFGLTTDHTSLYDPDDGTKSLERTIHINLVEQTLIDLGVNVRDLRGEVALNEWKVQVLEPTGTINTIIREVHPDKKIGCIRMILELADYE